MLGIRMRILSFYVLREHLAPFLLGLLVLTFILVVNRVFELVDLIIGKGLGTMTVLEVFLLSLPFILALTIPMAVLVASLVAFGRLSQDSETTALKAGGVNLYLTILPPLLAFSVLAVGLTYFNNHILPESNHRVKNLMIDISQKRPGMRLREGVFNPSIEGFNILVKKIDHRTSKLTDVVIYERRRGEIPRTIIAREGELLPSDETGLTQLRLYQGEIHELDKKDPRKYRRLTFQTHTLTLPIERELVRKERSYRGDRELSAKALLEKVRTASSEVRAAQQRLSDLGGGTEAETELRNMQHKKREIARYMVEVHKKYSIPFACIVFVLVGAPLGMMVGRGGRGIGTLSIPVFVLYYLFLVGGENLADRMVIPPWLGMWSPNIVLFILGALLTHHVIREAPSRLGECLSGLFYRKRRRDADSGQIPLT